MANPHDPFIKTAIRSSLVASGPDGMTWQELADILGVHHGVVSGRLSLMHKAGEIARLSHKRGGSKVYVINEHVADRPTEPYGRTPGACPNCGVTL